MGENLVETFRPKNGYKIKGEHHGRKNPDVNIRITLANLTYLYDNIKAQNETYAELGWDKMEDEEILKFAVALHNSGPDDDFGTGYRLELLAKNFESRGECFDPTLWECFKLVYKNAGGERTIIYVDNIFADDMNLPPNVAP